MSDNDNTDFKELTEEFGFDPNLAKLVLSITTNRQRALDWLQEHGDTPIEKLEAEFAKPPAPKDEDGEPVEEEEGSEAVSTEGMDYECGTCKKKFPTAAQAGIHKAKTDHENFDLVPKVPLTQEQKLAKLAELREKLAAKKAAQAKEDLLENKKNEAIRRKKDGESERLKEELKAREAQKEIEKQKKEKEADRLARKRVEEQIRLAQEERRAKASAAKAAREGRAVEEAPKPVAAPKPTTSANYTDARLQLRIQGQAPLIKTFSADTTLFEVAEAVKQDRDFDVKSFTMTFPRKSFTREDFGITLKEAKLVPSAALILD